MNMSIRIIHHRYLRNSGADDVRIIVEDRYPSRNRGNDVEVRRHRRSRPGVGRRGVDTVGRGNNVPCGVRKEGEKFKFRLDATILFEERPRVGRKDAVDVLPRESKTAVIGSNSFEVPEVEGPCDTEPDVLVRHGVVDRDTVTQGTVPCSEEASRSGEEAPAYAPNVGAVVHRRAMRHCVVSITSYHDGTTWYWYEVGKGNTMPLPTMYHGLF